MAFSVVDICNLSLSNLGLEGINALNDEVKAARQCTLKFPLARDSVLSEFPWNFAKKRQVLALLGDTVSGWDYAYSVPSDMLRAIKIYNPAGDQNDKINYEISLNDTNTKRIILTNQETAELVYIARVEDPNVFETAFVDALVLRLASDLAYAMKGDRALQGQMMQLYTRQLGLAQSANANERHKPDDRQSNYVTARR